MLTKEGFSLLGRQVQRVCLLSCKAKGGHDPIFLRLESKARRRPDHTCIHACSHRTAKKMCPQLNDCWFQSRHLQLIKHFSTGMQFFKKENPAPPFLCGQLCQNSSNLVQIKSIGFAVNTFRFGRGVQKKPIVLGREEIRKIGDSGGMFTKLSGHKKKCKHQEMHVDF